MKKILIVDDDVTFQLTMAAKLKEAGYLSVPALDGEKGLEMARSEKPDLLLLDIKMPKLDGLAMLKTLCDESTDKEPVPVFITSNLDGIDKISEGVALGVKGYIIKSDESLDTIVSAVHSVLNPTAVDTSTTN